MGKKTSAPYLDQHAVLEKGMTIQDVLKSAFDPLFKKEERMNEICDHLGEEPTGTRWKSLWKNWERSRMS